MAWFSPLLNGIVAPGLYKALDIHINTDIGKVIGAYLDGQPGATGNQVGGGIHQITCQVDFRVRQVEVCFLRAVYIEPKGCRTAGKENARCYLMGVGRDGNAMAVAGNPHIVTMRLQSQGMAVRADFYAMTVLAQGNAVGMWGQLMSMLRVDMGPGPEKSIVFYYF